MNISFYSAAVGAYQQQLRMNVHSQNIANINSGAYEYKAGIYYMDIISDLERTGDYIINVVDTISDTFLRHRA